MANRSATVEAGAELQAPPPRAGRRVTRHPLDRSLSMRQGADASEAHAHFRMALQSQHASADVRITAAPAASLRLDIVAADSSSGHDDTSP
jgi:hypothetical protein